MGAGPHQILQLLECRLRLRIGRRLERPTVAVQVGTIRRPEHLSEHSFRRGFLFLLGRSHVPFVGIPVFRVRGRKVRRRCRRTTLRVPEPSSPGGARSASSAAAGNGGSARRASGSPGSGPTPNGNFLSRFPPAFPLNIGVWGKVDLPGIGVPRKVPVVRLPCCYLEIGLALQQSTD